MWLFFVYCYKKLNWTFIMPFYLLILRHIVQSAGYLPDLSTQTQYCNSHYFNTHFKAEFIIFVWYRKFRKHTIIAQPAQWCWTLVAIKHMMKCVCIYANLFIFLCWLVIVVVVVYIELSFSINNFNAFYRKPQIILQQFYELIEDVVMDCKLLHIIIIIIILDCNDFDWPILYGCARRVPQALS